jgi:hypothetical protein
VNALVDGRGRGLVSARTLKVGSSVHSVAPLAKAGLICDLPASDKDSPVLTKLNPSRFHLSFGSSRAASTIPRITCLFRSVTHAAVATLGDSSQRHLCLHRTESTPVFVCLSPFWLLFRAATVAAFTGLLYPPLTHNPLWVNKQAGEDEDANSCFSSALRLECEDTNRTKILPPQPNGRPQHQTQTVELPLSSKLRQPNLDLVDLPILSIHP